MIEIFIAGIALGLLTGGVICIIFGGFCGGDCQCNCKEKKK